MKSSYLTTLILSALCLNASAQGRTEINLQDGWQFSRDGQSWQDVQVPHDWAISGPFDKKWDLQTVAIEQNGETEATEKSGRSGALPWIGDGQYKLSFNAPASFGRIRLSFDGAMAEPTIFVNDKQMGFWAYGYNAFDVDITDAVTPGAANTILVKLSNKEESSRWYPGAGLYRPVSLIITDNIYIDEWSTFLRTTKLTDSEATLVFSAKIAGPIDDEDLEASLSITDAQGKTILSEDLDPTTLSSIWKKLSIPNPHLWSPEDPYLYTAKLSLSKDGKVIDQQSFKTGIRTVSVSKENGFQLNGKTRKIKGVCLHHDLGPLGAAVNKDAIIRQIKIMKDMGADAIRTAHNMPGSLQMEVCDSLGMMVMAESFDMWIYPKCKNGYARFFKEWSDKDIENLIRRHRNHPSIIMWSIGNEIPEQGMSNGPAILTHLQDLCHKLDESRPVTQGMDNVDYALKTGFAQINDVPGFNYRVHKYAPNIDKFPQGFILGSETASTVSSRGIYKFPVEVSNTNTYPDGQCSSYDTEYCSWSNLPEDDFIAQDDLPYTIGQFVWTGFDYLGEPTPYDTFWPSRSSYFGICDLAGLPKDRFYLYRSQWNTSSHTLHILPHWTWPGREGQITPVYCYTDFPSAELFVNGKSQGKISKDKSSKMDRYRLRWNEVKYEPGEIKIVAYDEKGNKAAEQSLKTAGEATSINLSPDKTTLSANGNDLVFITVELQDKNNTPLPTASDLITFDVQGAGKFEAVCNGDATSLEPFKEPKMHLFSGKLVLILRAANHPGTITLKVTDQDQNLSADLSLKVE